MTPTMWLLSFLVYSTTDDMMADPGHVIARSCAAAEAWIRAGLRAGQAVQLGTCEPYRPELWRAVAGDE